MKRQSQQNGQGLLEAIFAIGVLLIAVVGVLGLTIANITGQAESEQQVIANNLAREGIEVVRGIRDSNWLNGSPWDSGLAGTGSDATAAPVFDTATNSWSLDFDYSAPALLYKFGGVYNHSGTGAPTIFRRLLTLLNVCRESDGSESIAADNSCATGEKVGIKVESLVTWQEHGRERLVTLSGVLYAWK